MYYLLTVDIAIAVWVAIAIVMLICGYIVIGAYIDTIREDREKRRRMERRHKHYYK